MKRKMRKGNKRPNGSISRFNILERRFSTPLHTDTIKLTGTVNVVNSNGSGVCAGAILLDPTVQSYTEGKGVSNLYTSFRLLSARLVLIRQTGDTTGRPVVFGAYLGTAPGTPTGYTQVTDQARKLIWSPSTDTTGKARFLNLDANRKLNYQEWATTSTDDAGAPGGFYFYGDGLSNSQPIFLYWVEAFFQLRNRS